MLITDLIMKIYIRINFSTSEASYLIISIRLINKRTLDNKTKTLKQRKKRDYKENQALVV